MTTNKLLILLLCLDHSSLSFAANAHNTTASVLHITRDHFSKILHTVLDDDTTLQHVQYAHEGTENGHDRQLIETPSQGVILTQNDDTWQKLVQHGWAWSKRHYNHKQVTHRGSRRRNLRSDLVDGGSKDAPKISPFVVCSASENQSGFQRRKEIVLSLKIPIEHAQTISNTMEESCFVVSSTAAAMESYQSEIAQAEADLPDETSEKGKKKVKLSPLLDALKVPGGTAMGILEDEDWSPPKIESEADLEKLKKRKRVNEFSQDNTTEVVDFNVRKWSKSFMVELIPGSVQDGASLEDVALDIIEYVKDMAQIPPGASSSTSYLRSNNTENSTLTANSAISTREAFSLTATVLNDEESSSNAMFPEGPSIWSTALSNGFEAHHGCQVLLDTLEVRPQSNQFEVILHPPSQFMKQAAVQSSAWNKDCALSLLMGLSVHPSVQTIEVSKPIVLASIEGKTNPQWITQSGQYNHRPFFSMSLDGTGQGEFVRRGRYSSISTCMYQHWRIICMNSPTVVGVADGGLDTDNCYLRDSSSSNLIYGRDANGWDFSQRKVVHYDDTFGDRIEESMGHGTYVSGIVNGRKSTDGINEVAGYADGTAPGSQLAFFDMEELNYGIADPGVERMLKSLYNPAIGAGDNKGARVINMSWGRSYYGEYTSFCRQYDAALRNDYPDLLLVVSAGNTGREGSSSIQDPASCKNPLAVGASLSDGTDSLWKENGIEYLADYSSRGPTQDNRMKPDIVAPGHFVLATLAVPGTVGECDGDSEPDVDNNNSGGAGVKYTTGTSMASPVLAGAAAILRQYFEEAYCDPSTCCGSKGCAASFNPSGSLIKAVLMNGAQPLTGGVQYVPNGDILYDQPLQPYDSNQGMGRVNLINSVPLAGQNNMQMKVVNNKFIVNGYKDIITLLIDKADCERDLSVTLAWYDPPATSGCKSCVVNDLDLFIRTSSGIVYPNGGSSKDSKNTVERIQISSSDGEEVRIVVEAKNFATYGEKYSLAITGCFSIRSTSTTAPIVQQEWQVDDIAEYSTPSTTAPIDQVDDIAEYSASSIERSFCPSDRLLQVALNTAHDGQQLTWNLIKSLNDGDVERIANGPGGSSGYENNKEYLFSACLEPSTRYRFQIRNTLGYSIEGWYKLTYNGLEIFSSQWAPRDQMGRVSTFRFGTNQYGMYQQLASNTFTPHVEFSESAEFGINGDENSNDGSRHMRRDR